MTHLEASSQETSPSDDPAPLTPTLDTIATSSIFALPSMQACSLLTSMRD